MLNAEIKCKNIIMAVSCGAMVVIKVMSILKRDLRFQLDHYEALFSVAERGLALNM